MSVNNFKNQIENLARELGEVNEQNKKIAVEYLHYQSLQKIEESITNLNENLTRTVGQLREDLRQRYENTQNVIVKNFEEFAKGQKK